MSDPTSALRKYAMTRPPSMELLLSRQRGAERETDRERGVLRGP